MREPPADVDDGQVLAVVREGWDADVAAVEHLPIGFGAHHWRAVAPGGGSYFVTLDGLLPHHTRGSLEAAYAGAAALADAGLEFVLAGLRGRTGRLTVPVAESAVSVVPWVDGTRGDGTATESMLSRLHATQPPPDLPSWRPLVGPDLADDLARRAATPWESGPHGERARTALREHLDDVAGWTAAYHRLATTTDPATWVATHGEPHSGNQLLTAAGTFLVDWESLRLAPRERDLGTLVDAGYHPAADPAMLTMFDLEWRLDEIAQYADWFEAPHPGNESDEVALAGLLGELAREGRHTADAPGRG